MVDSAVALAVFLGKVCWLIGQRLIWPMIAFALLALALKGRAALDDARRASAQTRTTLGLYVFDFFLVGPPLGLAVALIVSSVQQYGVALISSTTWSAVGAPITMVLTLFLGDFSSYWRHRLEHTRWLWPA